MSAELTVEPPVDPQLDRVAVEHARLIRLARVELLERSPTVTVELLAQARDASEGATRQWIHRQRKAGRLIAVEHRGRTLLPTFQFDEVFDLDPVVSDVVARLTALGMDGWATWRWFHVPNTWLDRRPVEVAAAGDVSALERAVEGLVSA